MKKIGDLGQGGAGLSAGHNDSDNASLKELFLAVRAEMDALYAKLDGEAQLADTYAGELEEFEA